MNTRSFCDPTFIVNMPRRAQGLRLQKKGEKLFSAFHHFFTTMFTFCTPKTVLANIQLFFFILKYLFPYAGIYL